MPGFAMSRSNPAPTQVPTDSDGYLPLSFVRVGGAAGMAAAGVIVVLFATQFVLPPPPSDSTTAELAHLAANASLLQLVNALYPLMHVLLLVFFLALYRRLAPAGGVARLGLVGGSLGLVMFFLTAVIYDGRIVLAGQYVGADPATKRAILAAVPVVERVQHVVSIAGHVLAWGVGVASFSAVGRRQSVLSRWTGWVGLVFGVVAWLYVLRLISSTFRPVLLLLNLLAIVWLVPTGLTMFREDIDDGSVSDTEDAQ